MSEEMVAILELICWAIGLVTGSLLCYWWFVINKEKKVINGK
jgi:hypothetical protein